MMMGERHRDTASDLTADGFQPSAGSHAFDFTKIRAGPLFTRYLTDVVKVEPPVGDDTRAWPPFDESDVGAIFTAVNRGKRSIALDLRVATGLAATHGFGVPVVGGAVCLPLPADVSRRRS